MASNRNRRIQKEIQETASDKHSRVVITVCGDANAMDHLEGSFHGPPDTPYEGGVYTIDISIPADYPFRPPKMKFRTRIWHPNVSSQTGAICLDTLASNWSPVLTMKSALISIQGLLASPEPKDPQDAEVAAMLLKNPKEYERIAREWAVKYAGAPLSGANSRDGHQHDAFKMNTPSADESATDVPQRFHPDLVGRFCAMGFDTDKVISAFEHVGVDPNNGRDYDLEDEDAGKVTARLFEEI